MRFADQRAQFNRQVVNRVVRPLSGRVPLWSLVEHTGRRSGRLYRTPVSVFGTRDGVAVLLPYGTDRDWVLNVRAVGGCRITMSGKTFATTDPRIVPTAEAAALLPAPWRQIVERLRVPSALLLTRAR